MNKKKITAIAVVVAAVAIAIVGATLAFFTDETEVVENTFTVGDINIDLDEVSTSEYGTPSEAGERVKKNEYKLIPGHEYTKDPTTYVEAKSEPCFVEMKVKVKGMDKLQEVVTKSDYPGYYDETKGGIFDFDMLVKDRNSAWTHVGMEGDDTYVFWYKGIVDARETDDITLEPLFEHFVCPGFLTNEQVAEIEAGGFEWDITSYAIQSADMNDAKDAWAKSGFNNSVSYFN